VAYYLNATREVYLRALRSARADSGYTYEEASWSLYLDVDKGTSNSLSSYSRQWGIQRNVLLDNWQDITRAAWVLASSDSRQWTPQAERYVSLAGAAYDESIAARSRTAMQGKETYRPPPDVVGRLRQNGQQKGNRSATDEQQKLALNGAETQAEQQKGNRSRIDRQQHSNTSSSSGSSKKPPKASPSPPGGGSFAPPDWVDPEVWTGFAQMRQRQRCPLTERAANLTIRALERLRQEGHDPNAVLDQSTQKGWRGVFPIEQDYTNGKHKNGHKRAAPPSEPDGGRDAGREAEIEQYGYAVDDLFRR
jgi:hypothetical protein